jgi:hypothetical protein
MTGTFSNPSSKLNLMRFINESLHRQLHDDELESFKTIFIMVFEETASSEHI